MKPKNLPLILLLLVCVYLSAGANNIARSNNLPTLVNVCPSFGDLEVPTTACQGDGFRPLVTNLDNFFTADHGCGTFSYGLEFFVFPGSTTPADPYTGGTSLGIARYEALRGAGTQDKEMLLLDVGTALVPGDYQVCVTLRPVPADAACRPTLCGPISIFSNPMVTEQPNDLEACEGDEVTFTSDAMDVSTGSITYQWQRVTPTVTNKTTADGLVDDVVNDVYGVGNDIYIATDGGVSVSNDACATFTNQTITDGLGSNQVNGIYFNEYNDVIYASTEGGPSFFDPFSGTYVNFVFPLVGNVMANDMHTYAGLVYIATDGGISYFGENTALPFALVRTTADGLGSNQVNGVYADGDRVYAATQDGLSISTDYGVSFTNITGAGLGSNIINEVQYHHGIIYAATEGGLSISTNDGASFTNITTADGLPSDAVNGMFINKKKWYVATDGGAAISYDGGLTFTILTTAEGLGSNMVNAIFTDNANELVYMATEGGLSVYDLNGVDIAGATAMDYTIPSVVEADEGLYRVVVMNETTDCMTMSNIVELIVNPLPVLTPQVVALCSAANPADLTTLEPSITAETGTFMYSVANPTAYDGSEGAVINVTFTNQDGCVAMTTITCSALPVELVNFQAEAIGTQYIQLQWQTASEYNSSHFELERSFNGKDFQYIHQLPTNQQASQYTWQDYQLIKTENTYYYRLKTVDLDGTYDYSPVVVVKLASTSKMTIYPTLVTDELHIDVQGETIEGIQIIGINKISKHTHTSTPINTSDLPAGIYSILVQTDKNIYTDRFLRL